MRQLMSLLGIGILVVGVVAVVYMLMNHSAQDGFEHQVGVNTTINVPTADVPAVSPRAQDQRIYNDRAVSLDRTQQNTDQSVNTRPVTPGDAPDTAGGQTGAGSSGGGTPSQP